MIANFLEDNLKKSKVKINFLGFIFLSFSAGSLQILLDRGELQDWFDSSYILFLLFFSIINLSLFIFNSFYSKNSLFPKELFKDNFYTGGLIFAFFIWFYSNTSIYINANIPNSNSILSHLFSGNNSMYFRARWDDRNFFTSKIIFYLGNVKTMLLGLFIYIISNIEVTFWTENISIEQITFNMIYRGISISIYYVALANITYTTLPDNLRTYGAGLFQFLEL